uniref:Uncharacterized protein n=1 Tax=Anopheles atroparvus TaxID=41427 RepID=A0AAG5DJD6_ANOAO
MASPFIAPIIYCSINYSLNDEWRLERMAYGLWQALRTEKRKLPAEKFKE